MELFNKIMIYKLTLIAETKKFKIMRGKTCKFCKPHWITLLIRIKI